LNASPISSYSIQPMSAKLKQHKKPHLVITTKAQLRLWLRPLNLLPQLGSKRTRRLLRTRLQRYYIFCACPSRRPLPHSLHRLGRSPLALEYDGRVHRWGFKISKHVTSATRPFESSHVSISQLPSRWRTHALDRVPDRDLFRNRRQRQRLLLLHRPIPKQCCPNQALRHLEIILKQHRYPCRVRMDRQNALLWLRIQMKCSCATGIGRRRHGRSSGSLIRVSDFCLGVRITDHGSTFFLYRN
jgi:hypothetical protein